MQPLGLASDARPTLERVHTMVGEFEGAQVPGGTNGLLQPLAPRPPRPTAGSQCALLCALIRRACVGDAVYCQTQRLRRGPIAAW